MDVQAAPMPSYAEPRPLLAGYVTIQEAAQEVGVSARTIKRWCAGGGLPIVKRGRTLLINIEKWHAWLAAGERGAMAPPKRRRG
jgi:excisionase family DNA binding protein